VFISIGARLVAGNLTSCPVLEPGRDLSQAVSRSWPANPPRPSPTRVRRCSRCLAKRRGSKWKHVDAFDICVRHRPPKRQGADSAPRRVAPCGGRACAGERTTAHPVGTRRAGEAASRAGSGATGGGVKRALKARRTRRWGCRAGRNGLTPWPLNPFPRGQSGLPGRASGCRARGHGSCRCSFRGAWAEGWAEAWTGGCLAPRSGPAQAAQRGALTPAAPPAEGCAPKTQFA
jgi:hypothetical protein